MNEYVLPEFTRCLQLIIFLLIKEGCEGGVYSMVNRGYYCIVHKPVMYTRIVGGYYGTGLIMNGMSCLCRQGAYNKLFFCPPT